MTDVVDLARTTLARIGDAWQAAAHERELLDFKETPATAEANPGPNATKRFLRLLGETAACLANTRGGVIVLGVRDSAPTRAEALQGVRDDSLTPQVIRSAIYENTDPPLTVEVGEHTEDGVPLLLVRVPEGAVVHGTSGGVHKHRREDRCVPLTGDALRGLYAARGQSDWSHEPSSIRPDGLSRTALAHAGERLRAVGSDELADLAERDAEQFLANCGLLHRGRVRRAGVLLFGSRESLMATVTGWGAIVTTAASPGAEGTILLRREESANRPLVLLLNDILTVVRARTSTESIRVGSGQVDLVDYADDVVRELVANAFAHRDWELPGVIEINHSPDELVISSPGGLLPGLRVDRLLRETAQRNRALAREIARLRIAEGAGLGFDRVWRLLASVGKEPPTISDGPSFVVSVPGGRGDRSFARFLNGPDFPIPALASDLDVLLALSLLRHNRTVTATGIAPALQRDPGFCERVLRRMHETGLIEATRGTARRQSPSYRLTPDVRAAMRTALTYRPTLSADSDDEKLIRHLRRHGRISNEDVRRYLDCDVAIARNRLTALRRRGVIDFAPDSPRRGPRVEYVPLENDDAGGRPGAGE